MSRWNETAIERADRLRTSCYVPDPVYCQVCRGRTMRGCRQCNHPYAYLPRVNGTTFPGDPEAPCETVIEGDGDGVNAVLFCLSVERGRQLRK